MGVPWWQGSYTSSFLISVSILLLVLCINYQTCDGQASGVGGVGSYDLPHKRFEYKYSFKVSAVDKIVYII